jgi:hypothetical protein
LLRASAAATLEAEKGPIAVFVIDSLEHPTQTTSPPSDAGLTFEVATIKPNNSGSNGRRFGFPGDRFEATNGTLRELIALAFGQPGPPPQPIPNYRISGGPNWMNSDRFDVIAKAADNMTGSTGARTKQLMLRTLLAQRFKLSLHNEFSRPAWPGSAPRRVR